MKSYEEMAQSVLCKRDGIIKKRAERRKRSMSFCAPAAALCLAFVIGIGVTHGNFNEKEPQIVEDALYPGIPDYIGPDEDGTAEIPENAEIGGENEIAIESEKRGGDGGLHAENTGSVLNDPICIDSDLPVSTMELTGAETSQPAEKNPLDPSESGSIPISGFCEGLFYINSIIGEATPAKRAFDKENYYGADLTAEEMEEYIGIDMEKIMASLPDDMVYIPHKHNIIMKTDGTIAYDAAHFLIEDGNGGKIVISAGRALPPYDCVYSLGSEKVSELEADKGTVSVLSGGKDYDEEKGAFGFFFADFEYNGVYFRLELENICKEKVIATLFKMIIG